MNTSKISYDLKSSLCRYCMCLFVLLSFFACSINAFGFPRTDDDLIEMTCGEEDSKHVLIAYDTIHGSTAEVGDRIGKNLCDQGFRVDLRLAAHVEDISEYDGVIIGSAIYEFAFLPDALAFIDQNRAELSQVPTAYFMVGASMSQDTPETREGAKKSYIDPLLEQFPEIEPVAIGLFGGAVDFTTNDYNLFERFVLRILGIILRFWNKADWRLWEVIDQWAVEVGEMI